MSSNRFGGARRLLVLDPDGISAMLVAALFGDAGYEVVAATNGPEALSIAFGAGTDAVVMETDCDGDGFSLCAEMRGRGYRGPLIFISRRHEINDKIRGFESGADDFVVKPFDPRELLARLEAAARRFRDEQHMALGRAIRVGDAVLSPGEGTFRIDGGRPAFLSPTEVRLLECLMRDSAVTISRDALVDRAWPNAFIGDTNRVDVVIARIRKKIEPNPSEPEYLHTVRGFGYTFRPPSRPRLASQANRDEPTASAASLTGA